VLLEWKYGNLFADSWRPTETREIRMIYFNGEAVQIGDAVHLGGDQNGLVVGIIDEGKYADGYHEEDWRYLRTGLIVSTDFGDLRLDKPDEDLALLARPEPGPLK